MDNELKVLHIYALQNNKKIFFKSEHRIFRRRKKFDSNFITTERRDSMGSGRDKRKKAKGHTPGLGADKTAKRTDKNAEKESRRLERKAKGGEGDIDALLAKFKLEDEAQSTVRIEENCIAPTPRVYATFIPLVIYGPGTP